MFFVDVELAAIGLMVVFPKSVVSFVMGVSFGAVFCPLGCAVGCPKLNIEGDGAPPDAPKTTAEGLFVTVVADA